MPSKFLKDRIIGLLDEIIAAAIIGAFGSALYFGRGLFSAFYTQSTLLEVLSIVLPLILLVLVGFYIWQRRGRYAWQTKGRILDERLREKGKYFVGRHELRQKFQRAIDPTGFRKPIGSETVSRLFAIYGIGGIGKSALVEEFRRMCYTHKVPFAYAEGSTIHTEIDLLKIIHEQLTECGVPFDIFQKGLDRYHKLQAKLATHQDISPKVLEMLSKGLVVTASAVPGGKQVAEAIGAENIEVALSAIYRLLNREDAQFFLNPEEELTKMLVDDLNDYLANATLALFFDTYEQMESLDDWLRTRLVERLSKQAVVVIAGRNGLHRDWGYTAIIRQELSELASDDVVKYLHEKGITDERVINEIVSFTGGLPLALTLINEMLRMHPGLSFADLPKEKDVLPALVEQMLRTAPDDIRDTLEVCATLRWFNVDLLKYMLDIDDDKARELFGRLQKLEFVIQKGKKGLALHDRLREFMDATAKFVDEKAYVARHEKAMGYFERGYATFQNNSNEYLDFFIEWLVHLNQIDTEKCINQILIKEYEYFVKRNTHLVERFSQSVKNSISLPKTELIFLIHYWNAQELSLYGRWQEAFVVAKKLTEFENIPSIMKGFLHYSLSTMERHLANYTSAKESAEICINCFKHSNFKVGVSLGYRLLAECLRSEKDYEKAYSHLKENLSYIEKENVIEFQYKIEEALGKVLFFLNKQNEALDYLNKALNGAIINGDFASEIQMLIYKGKLFFLQNRITDSNESYVEAKSKAKDSINYGWYGESLIGLARNSIYKNKINHAIEDYQKALLNKFKYNCIRLYKSLNEIITDCKQTNHPEILTQLLDYWQDPANTLDGLTLIEAEQRNRERENATGPTVVEQLQAAIKEMGENKGAASRRPYELT